MENHCYTDSVFILTSLNWLDLFSGHVFLELIKKKNTTRNYTSVPAHFLRFTSDGEKYICQ